MERRQFLRLVSGTAVGLTIPGIANAICPPRNLRIQGGTATPGTPCRPAGAPRYVATHYVTENATGGDGSFETPWTLAQALANARSGNAVQIAPGTYEAPSTGSGLTPVFRPSHDGTAANPIVFFAQYPAATEQDSNRWTRIRRSDEPSPVPNCPVPNDPVSCPIPNCPVIGAGGDGAYRRHIIFDGFYFHYNEGAAPSARGIVYLGWGNTGNKVRRCRFDRIYLGTSDNRDNFNCIQIHGSSDAEISDNLFNGGYDAAGNHNESCITTYGALGFVIENNTFRNVTTGIFVKGSMGGVGNQGRIRRNRFTGFRTGVELTENEDGGIVEIDQNIFYDWGQADSVAAIVFENSVVLEQRNFVVHHNTIIVPASGGTAGAVSLEPGITMTGNVFRDNLVVCLVAGNSQVLINAWGVSSLAPFAAWNHNVYYNNGATPTFSLNGTIYTGLTGPTGWRAASGRDANALVTAVQFVNVLAHDYRLQNNEQAALTASSSGGPVGCYITGNEAIGIRTS